MAAKKPMGKPSMAAMPDEQRYKAQDAMHTLQRAEEIKQDPALIKLVHTHAMHQKQAIGRVARMAKARAKT